MPDIRISHIDDPRIAAYVNLPERQSKAREGKFVVEGDFLVQRLLSSGCQVDSLLVSEDQRDRLAAVEDLTVYVAPRSLLPRITGFKFHRAMLGCGIRPQTRHLPETLENKELPSSAVICAAIRDQQNLGGILRNCAAFGVDLIMLAEHCADPWARRTLRVSMGATFRLNLCWSADFCRDLMRLRKELGFDLVASVLDATAEELVTSRRGRRWALLFGNEGYGLRQEWLDLCNRRVTIPMDMQTDSLNVAVASGIFLYHFTLGQGQ
jgi:tRNA G18 (ribose-2'-O)-methylase SpoU